MQSPEHRPPLIVILGPTAVGKTEVAIELASRLNGEIVSADSRLFYKGMDIGTAKPSAAERARTPHHLIDVANPDQTWSLALFQREARKVIAEIHARGRLPFLVGGTGQFVRAVIEEWQVPHAEPDKALRTALENWAEEIGKDGLHQRLAVLDLEAAAAIDARNMRRTVRALEVILSTGRLFSAQRRAGDSPYNLLLIGLQRPRVELYKRIDARVDAMIESGLIDEARGLLDQGYSPDLPALSAIGYREIIAYLQGKMSLEDAVVRIKRNTRIFVRRQANWFKSGDARIHWFQMRSETITQLEAMILKWLGEINIKP